MAAAQVSAAVVDATTATPLSSAAAVAAECEASRLEGNQLFQSGDYPAATAAYTIGLNLAASDEQRLPLWRNRAQCQLNLERFSAAEADASRVLALVPSDPKALFRRCLAREQLGKLGEAHADAVALFRADSRNVAVQPVLRRLEKEVRERRTEQDSLTGRVKAMMALLESGDTESEERRVQALNNLTTLVRDTSAAAPLVWVADPELAHLAPLAMEKAAAEPLRVAALRLLAMLARSSQSQGPTAVRRLAELLGPQRVIAALGQASEPVASATAYLFKTLLSAVTGLEQHVEAFRAHEEARRQPNSRLRQFPVITLDEQLRPLVDETLGALLKLVNSGRVTPWGRDAALELLLHFVGRKEGLNWTLQFIEVGGLVRLLEAAAAHNELGGALKVSPQGMTRTHCAALFNRLYDDCISDGQREAYREAVNDFLQDLLSDDCLDSKVEAMTAIQALFQGPQEVGSAMVARDGILQGMVLLAGSQLELHQRVALETLVFAANKKDKCSAIVAQAIPVLKHLYQNGIRDSIRVRALVAMCKLGSAAGSDASLGMLAEGSTLNLSRSCRRFLQRQSPDTTDPTTDGAADSTEPAPPSAADTTPLTPEQLDVARWAVEGLAYLSLDAEVKEELCGDTASIATLLAACRADSGDAALVYPAATMLVNLCNAYDQHELLPEMVELATYAKQHVPQMHEFDGAEWVQARCAALVQLGLFASLTALTLRQKALTAGGRELLARVFLAAGEAVEHRGRCSAEGGGRALLALATAGHDDSTPIGRQKAAQALARLAITQNPSVAFPGQRVLELSRPLLGLLVEEAPGLLNYEALLALTNVASLGGEARRRLAREPGALSSIEHYMFEEHPELQRAAVECICNLAADEHCAERLVGPDSDRVKMLLLLCEDTDDAALLRAAAGALAQLSSSRPRECIAQMQRVSVWAETLGALCAGPPDLAHRAAHIVRQMAVGGETPEDGAGLEAAQRLCQTQLLEVLMVLSRNEEPAKAAARGCAEEALAGLVAHGLIKSASKK